MTHFSIPVPLRTATLSLLLAAGLFTTTATPSQAGLSDYLGCFFGGCWGGGGGSGGGGGGGGSQTEDADPTGIIHPVFMVGGGFFPDEIHAQPGDEIKFYNLAYTNQKVRADDYSWESDYISKDQSWSMIVQEDTALEFRKSGYGSSMRGEIFLEPLPAAVDFGDLVDANGMVVGKGGQAVKTAEGLGYSLASVGGNLREVGDGLTSALGDPIGLGGLGLGLTSGLGIGNN